MNALTTRAGIVLISLATFIASADAQTPQASTEPPTIATATAGEWMPVPDIFPEGAEMQVLNGDPATGPADFYFSVPPNYTFPWHFHTPIEKVFVDQGTMRWEMRNGAEKVLEPGHYVHVPERSPHRVTCTGSTECLFFLASSGPFDIHLVDEEWNTIRSWRPDGAVGTTGER